MTLDTYLQELRAALKRLPADERAAVLDEVRSHLAEQVQELVAEGMDPGKAEVLAAANFGDPKEIAAGYDEGTGELRANDAVLRVAKAAAKGAGTAAVATGRVAGKALPSLFKIMAAVVITCIVVSGAVAIVAVVMADEWAPWISDTIEENAAIEVYRRDMTNIGMRSDPFYVPADVQRLEISAFVWDGPDCAAFTVTDPNGTVQFDSGRLCENDDVRTTLPPITGSWRITFNEGGSLEGDVLVRYYKG